MVCFVGRNFITALYLDPIVLAVKQTSSSGLQLVWVCRTTSRWTQQSGNVNAVNNVHPKKRRFQNRAVPERRYVASWLQKCTKSKPGHSSVVT